MGREYKLRNPVETPADNAVLVEALLAFANGRDVVILHQEDQNDEPAELSAVTRWTKQRASVSTDDRELFRSVLGRLLRSDELVNYCDDRIIVGRRYAIGSGMIRWGAGEAQLSISKPEVPGVIDEIYGPERVTKDSWLAAFWPYLRELHESVVREPVIEVRDDSYTLIEYRRFETVSAALTCGLFAVLAESGPYRTALARCKLPRCERFYLASKNPNGGPANRTYCNATHRDEHHNSAARRMASARRPK